MEDELLFFVIIGFEKTCTAIKCHPCVTQVFHTQIKYAGTENKHNFLGKSVTVDHNCRELQL